MRYRRLSSEIIKKAVKEVLRVLQEAGAVDVADEEHAVKVGVQVMEDYENRVKALEERARALVDEQIKNFPDADYTRAFQLALKKLSEKERIPL